MKTRQYLAVLNIEDLTGVWKRGFIAWPDGRRDEATRVTWMQATTFYVDLRQPSWRSGCFTSSCLHRLSMAECETLATQQGFAGVLEQRGTTFEWVRIIDFQPRTPIRDIGRLYWQSDILVEEGVETEYLEHWHREPASAQAPCAALQLRSVEDARGAFLVRVGDAFMFARDRLQPVEGATLVQAIAGAASLRAAQQLLDFEISLGHVEGDRWHITRSSLPFRGGSDFHAMPELDSRFRIADIDPAGGPVTRLWEITDGQGELSMFLNTNP